MYYEIPIYGDDVWLKKVRDAFGGHNSLPPNLVSVDRDTYYWQLGRWGMRFKETRQIFMHQGVLKSPFPPYVNAQVEIVPTMHAFVTLLRTPPELFYDMFGLPEGSLYFCTEGYDNTDSEVRLSMPIMDRIVLNLSHEFKLHADQFSEDDLWKALDKKTKGNGS